MRRLCWLIALAVPLVCVGDELPTTVTLPTKAVVTETNSVPATITTARVIDEIAVGHWYVVRSKTPLFVLDVPAGSVSIISGVASAHGIFAGGEGRPELRTFADDESTYLIQGLQPCQCEIILIPIGVTDRSHIWRQRLTVSGQGPKPPPEPAPTPDPVIPTPTKSFRVIFVVESGVTLSAAQSAIPTAERIRTFLDASTTAEAGVTGWREYDPDQIVDNEQPTMRALWQAVKPKLLPAPCWVIEQNGHATVMPFPATVDECLATLQKFGGAQ